MYIEYRYYISAQFMETKVIRRGHKNFLQIQIHFRSDWSFDSEFYLVLPKLSSTVCNAGCDYLYKWCKII